VDQLTDTGYVGIPVVYPAQYPSVRASLLYITAASHLTHTRCTSNWVVQQGGLRARADSQGVELRDRQTEHRWWNKDGHRVWARRYIVDGQGETI